MLSSNVKPIAAELRLIGQADHLHEVRKETAIVTVGAHRYRYGEQAWNRVS